MAGRLKKERSTAKNKLTRTSKGIKNLVNGREAISIIKSRYEGLKTAWIELQEKHEEYFLALLTEDETDIAETWMEVVTTEFDDTDALVSQYIDETEAVERTRIKLKREEEAAAAKVEENTRKLNAVIAKKSIELMMFRSSCDTIEKILKKPVRTSIESEMKITMTRLENIVKDMQQIQHELMVLSDEEQYTDTKWFSDVIEIHDDIIGKAELYRTMLPSEPKVLSRTGKRK